MKPEKHTHTLKAGDPPTYYKPKTRTAVQKKKDNAHSSLHAGSQVKVLGKSLFNVIPSRGMRREMAQT